MRDPHVVSLRYRAVPTPTVIFKDPPPLEGEEDAFAYRLAGEALVCTMRHHFASAAEACAAVDPFLRAWEVRTQLERDTPEIRFEYEDVEVVDRNPPPPGQAVQVAVSRMHVLSMDAVVAVERRAFPEPPGRFRLAPDAESMWVRFSAYREGREPLPSMAYFCLTVLEASAGGRSRAAAAYNVDVDILRSIGRFTSERRGDAASARKRKPGVDPLPLSAAERTWLESAIRKLILRAGEIAAGGAALPRLTMGDLPTVPESRRGPEST